MVEIHLDLFSSLMSRSREILLVWESDYETFSVAKAVYLKVWQSISDKFMESREVLTFTVSYLLKRPRRIFLEKFSKYRFRLKHSAKSKSLIFQLLKSQLIPEILQLRTLQCLRLKFSVNQSVCFRKSIIRYNLYHHLLYC